ncbi:MAG TPA: hypothetical protein VFV34_07145 [Blastocatellia bacterium]|nr:hypothetical protein [Blastocatellia bacterium]
MKKSGFPCLTAAMGMILLVSLVHRENVHASDCGRTSTGLVPLTELGSGTYQGYLGGLYADGENVRPVGHQQAGLEQSLKVVPRKAGGKPKSKGRIVLLSIGMSNTTQEFSTFKTLADADPIRNPRLVIVDGAQGGMTASSITNPDDSKMQVFWETVDARLAAADVTAKQVQVVWLKEADARPTAGFPQHAITLQHELETAVQILKQRFPNLQLVYCSSRIYAGYASTDLNPEPFAYESGFAVRWMIERQIEGSPDLNFDPIRGEVKAPWLSWGPYLWADGLNVRDDGLTWSCSDYANDGTHPAPGGARDKVARMLLDFFKTDSTASGWFLAR